jgi:hypothetical protein
VDDPEQPGAHGQLPVVCVQRSVGSDERVLEHILGVVAAREEMPGVPLQPLVVTVVEDLERLVVASPEERDQLLV